MFVYTVGTGMSGETTAGGVCGVNVWCSRSVDISDRTVSRYRYRMEQVWRYVVPTAHVQTAGSTFKLRKASESDFW